MVARISGARKRHEAEQDGRAWLAWHVAQFMRAKKIPEFKSLLVRRAPKKQTPDEQVMALDNLFLALGGDPAELKKIKQSEGAGRVE